MNIIVTTHPFEKDNKFVLQLTEKYNCNIKKKRRYSHSIYKEKYFSQSRINEIIQILKKK